MAVTGLGYVIVGGMFWYVRRRFDDLASAADRYRDRAVAAVRAAQAAAGAAEREEAAYRLHRRLRQVFPALGLRLAALQPDTGDDPASSEAVAALSLITTRADAALDEVVAGLRAEGEGTDNEGTFGTGRDRSGFIGSSGMGDAAALDAHDPELMLARLGASRWALVRTIMAARIGIAAALLLLADRPGGGPGGSWWNVAAFTAYLAWAVATTVAFRPVLDLVTRVPVWLWVEQGMCVGLVILGGGVRAVTVYLCAFPVILATVFIRPRVGAMLAAGDAAVVALALGGTTLVGVTAGTEPVHGTEWPPALVGLFVAVALFAYVRRLFIELERTGVAYRARSREIALSVAAEARARVATAAHADVARRLDGVVPRIRIQLATLRGLRQSEEGWKAECDHLERLTDHLEASLEELTPPSSTSQDHASIRDVLAAAVTRVHVLGAGDIHHVTAGADGAVCNPEMADALGRFTEEALWNAHKHGRPPITVTAKAAEGRVTVAVTDHGDGFQPRAASPRLGLESLRRDAQLLFGEMTIASLPGGPVTVTLTFPLAADV